MENHNGWETYSKLVLQQLETMSSGIESLRTELQDVKSQLTSLKAKEDRVQDLKAWKEKMDEAATPSQVKEVLQEVEQLKVFRTKAVTMFMVVQTIMGIAMAWALEISPMFFMALKLGLFTCAAVFISEKRPGLLPWVTMLYMSVVAWHLIWLSQIT